MTVDQAKDYIIQHKPLIIHVSGKTSTGKSTFARTLGVELGYSVIELDAVMHEAVIDPRSLDPAEVFVKVYRERDKMEWVRPFVERARQKIKCELKAGNHVIFDGAIANIDTLRDVLNGFDSAEIVYFHPLHLQVYESYLTQRFMLTRSDFRAGLPEKFWNCIAQSDFNQFYKDRKLTDRLKSSIAAYAKASQTESKARLKTIQDVFKNVLVVNI